MASAPKAPQEASPRARSAAGGSFQIRFKLDRTAITETFEETVTVGEVFARVREKVGIEDLKLVIAGVKPVTIEERDASKPLAACVTDRRFACTIVPL
jgi:hypothetical protein